MANLNERGQIILVAAFALGVIFIALAVVVNAAIFTENLATRNEATTGSDALEFRHEVEQSVGSVLESVNTDDAPHSTLEGRLEDNTTEVNNQGGYWQAESGRVVSVEYHSSTEGERFSQDSTANFTDDGNSTHWNLTSAYTVEESRSIRLNVTDDSTMWSTESAAFELALVDTAGNEWNMSVTENSPGVELTVNANGETASCSTDTEEPTIGVTAGTLDGEPCSALRTHDGTSMWYESGLSGDYRMMFRNGDNIIGTYEGVVKGTGLNNAKFDDNADAASSNALYSGTVRYTYDTGSVLYETDVIVVPGRPRK